MNVNGILFLTVNSTGRVSLWDSQAEAMDGKEADEINVQLTLTVEQHRAVLRAEALARDRKRSGV